MLGDKGKKSEEGTKSEVINWEADPIVVHCFLYKDDTFYLTRGQ
jgi:hypothetical protein